MPAMQSCLYGFFVTQDSFPFICFSQAAMFHLVKNVIYHFIPFAKMKPNGEHYRLAALELSSDCKPLAASPVDAVLEGSKSNDLSILQFLQDFRFVFQID